MTRRATVAIVAGTFVATLLPPLHPPAGEGFVVGVSEHSRQVGLGRADISKLFLGRTTTWPSGMAAVPCDLSGTNPIRNTFSLAVHGKPVRAVIAFWQQEIASGRSKPPHVCSSDEAALLFVQENAGGVAYLGDHVSLGPGVKVLAILP